VVCGAVVTGRLKGRGLAGKPLTILRDAALEAGLARVTAPAAHTQTSQQVASATLPLAVAIGVLGRHLGDLKEFCPAMVGQAPEAYKHFDAREEGWTKVVLHPNQTR
jgi:hypothetical protein